MLHEEITSEIIKAFYKVYNELGYGFLEKVYERSMYIELRKSGLEVVSQQKLEVFYDGHLVGEYFADLVVEGKVILELKCAEGLSIENEAQLYNYLKAAELEIGLLMNFGKKAEFRRKIFTNDRKAV
jgi:GxxExxY protein